ncbi:hypothetical protein GCM10010483_06500 [Actinokineospora diospyrosa]
MYLAAAFAAALSAALLGGGTAAAGRFPAELRLPDGFRPEGIAIGTRPVAYFGSLADGRIHQVDLRTGAGRQLSAPAGGPSAGLAVDPARHRLFVAGGTSGEVRVIDTRDGALLANYPVAASGSYVNDVVIAGDAVWLTDSFQPRLYKLSLGPGGELPSALETVTLGGQWQNLPDSFNANGIATTPDGRALLVGHSAAGALFRVDPGTGVASVVDLGGATLPGADGLLRVGRDLYVVEGDGGRVSKVGLRADGAVGLVERALTDHRFDHASTVAAFGDRLYVVNARFSVVPVAGTRYTAVAVPRF